MGTGDLNGDDKPDIILRHLNGNLKVWFMSGVTRIGEMALNPGGSDLNWQVVGAGGVWQSVALSATTQASPPSVTLRWRNSSGRPFTVQKKVGTNWTTLVSNYRLSSYTNTGVQVGGTYEYQVRDPSGSSTYYESRYVAAAVSAPPTDYRGRVILLADATIASSLRLDIGQLTNDLIGDGWKVLYHEVPRHDDNVWTSNPPRIQQIKGVVQTDYNLAPGDTNVLFLLGHVAVPYSGTLAADGHVCNTTAPQPWHSGAWPCDGYYAELTGTTWSDSALVPACDFSENANLPGDGKWDQNEFTSPLELAFGRVDFARMPAFGVNPPVGTNADPREVALLRQYLAKDHKYRHKMTPLDFSGAETAALGSYFGLNSSPSLQEQDQIRLSSGLRTAASWFGLSSGKAVEGDIFQGVGKRLLGVQAGFGAPDAINAYFPQGHLYTTANLADTNRAEPQMCFYQLFGSYFGDWNMTNDFLRATLATPNYGLLGLWSAGFWGLQTMANGAPAGMEVRRARNEAPEQLSGATRSRELALLGDPTLRLHVLAPPMNVQRSPSMVLSWTPSPEPGAQYLVFGASNMASDFTRITTTPIAQTNLTVPARTVYQVRALAVKVSGAGSYTNQSQGAFFQP